MPSLCLPARALALALLAAGSWTSAAAAATISVDRTCYADPDLREDSAKLTGSGFTPGGTYQVILDGKAIQGASGAADSGGNLSGTLKPLPALEEGDRQTAHILTVRQGAIDASTRFAVSDLHAAFSPARGNLTTLKVRYTVHGFALAGSSRPTVYVHYVDPKGKLKTTVRLGVAGGSCGKLETKVKRALFPFKDAAVGDWTLQFDTSKTYSRGTDKSPFLFFRRGVEVAKQADD